jgi:hypothetical protein
MGIHEAQSHNAPSNKHPAVSHSGRSQHFSMSFQFGHSTSLFLTVVGHSTSFCPFNSVTALLFVLTFRSQHFCLSSKFSHNTSLVLTIMLQHISFPTINTTTAIKIITKLLSVIPVFQTWCFCTSFLVLC